MASSTGHLLVLSLFLGLLSIGANARPGVHFHPCKTLFISSFTISSIKPPRLDTPLNPNSDQNPSRFFAVFSEINELHPKQPFDIFVDLDRRPDFQFNSEFQFPGPLHFRTLDKPEIHRPAVPFGSFGVSSLRERTKDILSVVVALLFGVGCGALTSATMYLAWSLITNRYEARGTEDDDSDFDDDVSPNKMGYVKIPSATPAAYPVPTPAKEVV